MQEVNGSIPFISTIYLRVDGGARFKLIAGCLEGLVPFV
jgi:hypothetical protein